MLLEDDDDGFIDDVPTPSSSSESTCVVNSSGSSKEDADEVIPMPSSRSTRARRRCRGGPQTRSCDADNPISLDSDSDGADPDDSASEDRESRGPESWWSAQYRDEYDWDPSIGVKLDLLLRILKKTCDIGDKMIIFTQSLLSLDLLERFLGELHRQCLANQVCPLLLSAINCHTVTHETEASSFCSSIQMLLLFQDLDRNNISTRQAFRGHVPITLAYSDSVFILNTKPYNSVNGKRWKKQLW